MNEQIGLSEETSEKDTDAGNQQSPTSSTESGFNLGKAVGSIASRMQPGDSRLSSGDIAELRRISPEAPFTPALWRVLLSLDLADSPGWIRQETWERRWATLMMGMAYCAGLHEFEVPLGRALLNAGWSELRFVRLLRSQGEALEIEVRRVAQFLASKAQPTNWTDVANLLFYQSGESGENIRLGISRSYYTAQYAAEKQE